MSLDTQPRTKKVDFINWYHLVKTDSTDYTTFNFFQFFFDFLGFSEVPATRPLTAAADQSTGQTNSILD